MIFLLVLVIAAALVFALYRWLARGHSSRRSLRSVLTLGIASGVIRATITGLGFYGVEHPGGPLEAPAFAMALAGWPEIALLGPHRGTASAAFYGRMTLLLIGTSTVAVALIAFAARRHPRSRG